MLINATEIEGYGIYATDGEIGGVKDFYFDDHYWAIRYLVADSGTIFPGREVLIAPHALLNTDKNQHQLHVELSRDQIRNSPPLVTDTPITRDYEQRYFGYFGWAPYWGGPYMWGYSPLIFRNRPDNTELIEDDRLADPDLHSVNEVRGYDISALDGDLGHVEDFIIDDEVWAIRYLVIDTRNWWPGKKVLVAPSWVDGVSWADTIVHISLPRDQMKEAPEFTGLADLTRGYEAELYAYYGKDGYWAPVSEPAPKARLY